MHCGEIILGRNLMQSRKPYRAEWKIFSRNKLDSREWLVQKTTATTMQIIHKDTREVREILL